MNMSVTRAIIRALYNPANSNRMIAKLHSVSPNTVRDYRRRIKNAQLTPQQVKALDDSELQKLLWPMRRKPTHRPLPDWKAVHQQMQARHQVLLQIWEEYRRTNPIGAYSYPQFTYFYRQFLAG